MPLLPPPTSRRTRLFLFLLCSIGIIIAAWQTHHFISEYTTLSFQPQQFNTKPPQSLLYWMLLGVALQLIAHTVRAYKQKMLLSPITHTSTSFLFQSLTIGFLFNTLLPLRVGELIRAHVIGKTLKISRTVIFLTIVFERIVDATILLGLCALYMQYTGAMKLFSLLVPLILLTIVGYCIIILLYKEPHQLLRMIYHVTALFNKRIKNQTRFIAWSALYGTKTIIHESRIWSYIGLSIGMWTLYLASLYTVYQAIFVIEQPMTLMAASIGSYISAALPSGPAFIGTYHTYTNTFLTSLQLQPVDLIVFATIISWGLFILPTALIGSLLLLFSKRGQFTFFSPNTEPNDTQHKLLRFSDITEQLSDFLETYFRAIPLGKILSTHEMSGKIRLLQTLTGGSKATTVLVEKEGQKVVRKTALPEDGQKLIDQYRWLETRSHLPQIPTVVGMDTDDHSVSIEIAYESGYIPLYDYIHSHTPEQNTTALIQVLEFMRDHIYINGKKTKNKEAVLQYIKKKMVDKLQETAAISLQIQELLRHETIVVNGRSYKNLPQLIDHILQEDVIINELSVFYETTIHGDLTIDNIIINENGQFLLLDPNNENAISDPVVDYAKIYQSLHSGYEFLCTLEYVHINGNSIEFTEEISSKYHELFSAVDSTLQELLSPEQYRALLFHEAVHYCRMLPYRVAINPKTVGVFYGIATRLLNEFYDSKNS